ncbi:conserved hypothetical protein [Metallosphaera cuprina Ar-4]|uniref:Uncharacterized protein n=2 Tax=Metallosphaera TaxID=41980 RepID=F4G2U3_METCR|nr:conserved hypothetical protein [Metallosphaera cuprina Ar-4]
MSLSSLLRGKRKLLVPLLFLTFLLPIVSADVIYFYQGTINVSTTQSPITLAVGPNGNVNNYISTTVPQGNSSFTANIYVTNSTYAYFYNAVKMNVNKAGNLYTNVTISPSTASYINNMWLIISSSSSTYVIQIIQNGKPISSQTTYTLTPGTYYISFLVQPNTPLPNPSQSIIETVTVNLGDNLVSSTPIPLPPV